jgi:hypothetical protein
MEVDRSTTTVWRELHSGLAKLEDMARASAEAAEARLARVRLPGGGGVQE